MRREFKLGEGDRLEGLRVIGFHGEVDPGQTPGRREPLFADEQGRLVGLEGVEPAPVRSVWGEVGAPAGEALPGVATRLERPLPAHWRHLVVVLGRTELSHVDALASVEPHARAPRVDELLRWLADPAMSPPTELRVQRLGEAVAWYCAPADAFALYQRIGRVAEREMARASNEGSEGALYQASWWLARAALDDSDRYFAAVGLERSDRGLADAYVKATFRRRPAQEVEAGLGHARAVFESQCAEARQRAAASALGHAGHDDAPRGRGGGPDIGTLFQARARMRQRFLVRQAA